MKNASPALIALLATRSFVNADLYTFTLAGGTVFRVANADVAMTDGVTTWSKNPPIDPKSSRTAGHWKIGLDTDTWSTTIVPRNTDPVTGSAYPDTINGVPFLSAARGGALDGADVLIERGYLAAWPIPWTPTVTFTGKIVMFRGRVSKVDVTRSACKIEIEDYRSLLRQLMPRNLFQAPCRHTLFDAGCTLSAGAFQVSGTVGAGSTGNTLYATLAQAAGYFSLGRVVMTSGNNNTLARGVRFWDGAKFTLLSPFPFDLMAGDTFHVFPGCDKAFSTCRDKFSNTVNYGGTPTIPVAESMV